MDDLLNGGIAGQLRDTARNLHAMSEDRALHGAIAAVAARGGRRLPELCDHCLRTPSDETPRIQEGLMAMGHTLCWLIERAIFPRGPAAGAAA